MIPAGVELDAQIPAEDSPGEAAGVGHRQADNGPREGTPQDLHIPRGDIHRCHRLSESTRKSRFVSRYLSAFLSSSIHRPLLFHPSLGPVSLLSPRVGQSSPLHRPLKPTNCPPIRIFHATSGHREFHRFSRADGGLENDESAVDFTSRRFFLRASTEIPPPSRFGAQSYFTIVV